MASRKYFVLLSRYDAESRWEIVGGSYDRSEIDFERQDYRDHGVRASDLKIITCGARQSSIDTAVMALNAKSRVTPDDAAVHAEVAADLAASKDVADDLAKREG
jgi:hypothetical protein